MPPETATAVTAVALLELPTLDGLTQNQVRGASCIWCDTVLRTATAIDLGERKHRRLDGRFSTFPRSCRQCTHDAAEAALREHTGMCEQCADDASICTQAGLLRKLIGDCR